MAILEVDSVFFSYEPESELLHGGNLSCDRGEIVGLLGRNGSGKSTLLRIIWGTVHAAGATIRVNGKNLAESHRPALVSHLPQESCLPRDRRVCRCVEDFVPAASRQEFLDAHPRICGLLKRRTGELSGGELRYLELLLILSLGRPIILLDEPFSRIEPIYVQAMKEELQKGRMARCVILTDHCYQDVMEVCSPVYLLRSGRIRPVRGADDLREYIPADASSSRVAHRGP